MRIIPGATDSVFGRRQLLRGAAGAAVAGGLALAGCGQRARPTDQSPVVTITFQPHLVGMPAANRSSAIKLVNEGLAQFSSQGGSKGIRVQALPSSGTVGTLASIIAGAGPDVIQDYVYSSFVDHNFVAPLDEYFKQDGIDTSIWSAGQMAVYVREGQTYAVPAFTGTVVYAVNYGVFDLASQSYPSPDWTSDDFVAVCRALTGMVNGKKRWGGMLYQWSNTLGNGARWIFNAFNGAVMNPSGTQSTLSSPGSLAAGRWMFHELYWPQICATISTPNFYTLLPQGLLSMEPIGSWVLLQKVAAYQGLKWDILPFPVFPAGRTTLSNDDFWALNSQSKHPKQAWEVMKWASAGVFWNKFNMKLQLLTPARNDLWDYWVAVVQQVAPPLKGKQLQWFADAAQKGYALAPQYYRYNNQMADTVVGSWLAKLSNQQETSVATAFKNADNQVNAIERQGRTVAGSQAAVVGELSAAAHANGVYSFPAPKQTGLGAPPALAPSLLSTERGGMYTLLGNGSAVWGISDNCAFAGSAGVRSEATYTCRVAGIHNATCPELSQWANVGLMVRQDLSTDAPMLLLGVTGSHGLELVYRVLAGQNCGRQLAAQSGAGIGLIGPSVLSAASTASATISAVKPIWLQLRRHGGTWSAYTSWDGRTYSQAGTPLTVEMAGAWVGLYACANNGQFKNSGTIKAAFDHVQGFAPSTVVQIGRA